MVSKHGWLTILVLVSNTHVFPHSSNLLTSNLEEDFKQIYLSKKDEQFCSKEIGQSRGNRSLALRLDFSHSANLLANGKCFCLSKAIGFLLKKIAVIG